jgi:nucleoside-diphosphate-sugar epimerase
VERGLELSVLNRGKSATYPVAGQAEEIHADVRGEPAAVARALGSRTFDAVVDWIAFTPDDVERDITLFTNRTRQFVFISSASVYQKPPAGYIVTESTPLVNPYWEYSRQKIACEERLMRAHREVGFPVTIVRPSLTYGPSMIPLCIGSWQRPYTVVARMKQGRPLIVPGDGSSLWTVTWNGDFAKGLVGLLGCAAAIGEAFHITSDEVLTWDQIYLEVGRAAGVAPRLVHIASDLLAAWHSEKRGSLLGDKAVSQVFDNSKIKRFVPGFRATVTWAEGVRRALAWFEADSSRRLIDEAADRRWDTIIAAYRKAFPEGAELP